MGKKGKQQSRKAKKKELNKKNQKIADEKNEENEDWEMKNDLECQILKRVYGKKKKSDKEQLEWLHRNFFVLQNIRSSLSKERWAEFWKWQQDPNFQIDYTWDQWAKGYSKSEEEEWEEEMRAKYSTYWVQTARREFLRERWPLSQPSYNYTGLKQQLRQFNDWMKWRRM